MSYFEKLKETASISLGMGVLFPFVFLVFYFIGEFLLHSLPKKYYYVTNKFTTDSLDKPETAMVALRNIKYKNDYLRYYECKKLMNDCIISDASDFVSEDTYVFIDWYDEDLSLVFIPSRFNKLDFLYWVHKDALHDKPKNRRKMSSAP